MVACEPCWNEAYRQTRLLGGSQVDHYQRLIETLPNHPHTEAREERATNAHPADDHAGEAK